MLQSKALEATLRALDNCLPQGRPVEALEAGGGSFTHIRIARESRVTVLDISREQLDRNSYAQERILGDLEEFDGQAGRFDLIVCYDVVEHLNRPRRALVNMARMLAPGGALVVGCPNRASLKGLVTRYTPHGFHVWYYRYLRGCADAGLPGHAPFPAPMKPEMGMDAILQTARELDLEVASKQHYVSESVEDLKTRFPLLHALYAPVAKLVGAFTLPWTDSEDTDIILVLRRKAEAGVNARNVSTTAGYAERARRLLNA